jgi:pyruvate dehydrogenase E2 component (dihydrolipoamide acetyltransferase)
VGNDGRETNMATEITMPRLSDQMEEATILRWTKAEGEVVEKGDPIAEIETDKATWLVEAESSGELLRIVVGEGGVAPVGAVLGFIGEAGEALPEEAGAAPPAPSRADRDGRTTVTERTSATGRDGPASGRAKATPVARRTADELGVRLERVAGTGPGGRIVRGDVLAAASATAPADAPGRGDGALVELTPTQRTVARRMTQAATTIPHFALDAQIDMEAAVALRSDLDELSPERAPSLNDIVIKAVALALRDFPALNASYGDGRVLRWPRINVGVAVATEEALLVPVIFDADRKPLAQIGRESRSLIEKAQARSLTPMELSEGTFTVSNLGMFGVRSFTAVINPPQAAILAVGELARRAVVDDSGAVVGRRLMDVRLSCDHRIVNGADAARFLARVRELLERPLALTL